MKTIIHYIICTALLALVGCTGDKSVRQLPHLGNTPYQQDSVLVTYATNPDRALTLLDSALFLGNISDYRGRFIRARIYSKSLMQQQQDSAIQICKALLTHDSVRNAPVEQENIYDMLIAASRVKHDLVAYLHWATKKAELCQQQGEETERWRTEADIGYLMTRLGQVDEGLCKLDEVIGHLDAPGSIDRMDAFVVAVKRKINALNDLHRFKEVILLAQRILDRLDHYEQHANDYAEDSYRLSWSNNPNDRDRYLDFSRAQAWGFLAQAYSLISEELRVKSEELAAAQKAREYLVLFDQSDYGKTFMARRMIAPTQMALGMYDEALATYDEVQRRMDGDTLNDDYAVILRSRATAAYAQATTNSQFSTLNSQLKSAYDYQTRYATLSKAVSDSLHRSEAHDYAARYHAAEQEWEIQRKEAQIERSLIINIALGIGFLFVLMAAIYVYRQKRIVSQKNHALVRMINEQMDDASTPPVTEVPLALRRGGRGEGPLFSSIDAAIRGERLYKNVNLQRQDICERFSINRHALNELLTEYADGLSFPQYINSIRIQEALRLLHDEPTKTVSAIAAEVGFTSANLREQFKRKYGVTPAEYRQNQ